MRTRHTMTISLPPEMMREVEVVRKAERRTRSELIREALRTYFGIRRTYAPNATERRAIEAGRRALRRGEYVTFDDLRDSLAAQDREPISPSAESR